MSKISIVFQTLMILLITKVKSFDVHQSLRQITSQNQGLFGPIIDPDTYKTFGEILKQNGFGFESHEVITKDGYILTVFRIIT